MMLVTVHSLIVGEVEIDVLLNITIMSLMVSFVFGVMH